MKHWTKDLICPVCGNDFKATAKATVCGSTCRTRLYRMLELGEKPAFLLKAELNRQKLPKIKERLKIDPEAQYRNLEAKARNNELINRLIREERNKPLPPGMPVKQWGLQKSEAISELEKQLIP